MQDLLVVLLVFLVCSSMLTVCFLHQSPPKSATTKLEQDNFPSHTIIKTDTTTRKIQTRAKFYLPDSCCGNKNRIE